MEVGVHVLCEHAAPLFGGVLLDATRNRWVNLSIGKLHEVDEFLTVSVLSSLDIGRVEEDS